MYRRVLPYLTLVAILACNAENSTQPPPPLTSSASPTISDGAHPVVGVPTNPDFFFLPGAVPDPKNHADFGDPFNGSLLPLVHICELNAASDAAVNKDTPCTSNATGFDPYNQSFQLTAANVNLVKEHYQLDWMVPVSPATYYRITVMGGSTRLGFFDVKTATNAKDLKVDKNLFVGRIDGSDLAIKFRIEEFALCDTPGLGPCSSESVDLDDGATVQTTFTGDTGPTGIEIQPNSGNTTHVVTIEECESLNDRVTDLPTASKCARITLDPPLTQNFGVPAIMFFCSIAKVETPGAPQKRTVHRFQENGNGGTLTALRHVDPEACGPQITSSGASLKGMLADLVRGRLKSAGKQLVAMVSPRPLHATIMLDEGGGGETEGASDFQILDPAKVTIVAGNNQTGVAGGELPTDLTVFVSTLNDEPVAGARITFTPANGSADPLVVVTGLDGLASTSWTIQEGANTLTASGRGIAGDDFNGPRGGVEVVDPFQPIQAPFDDVDLEEETGPEGVEVKTGSVQFSATGYLPEPVSAGGFDFGEDGYSSMQLAQNADAPAGWETAAFVPGANGFTVGTGAPFGTGTGCGLGTLDTPWTLGTDILVRKKFSLSMAATLNIRVSVDNDLVDIYLNGVKLNGATLPHEGCAAPGDDLHDFEFAAAANAGVNTLAIRARDRGGESYLNVTAIPTPILTFTGSEPWLEGSRKYNLAVTNWADYPAALFVASPDLPPCGLNTSASRTWVDIFDGNDNSRIYGFCALGSPSDLQYLWFASSPTVPTTPVYIKLIDRKYVGSGTVDRLFYQSNSVAISPPPS